MKPDVVIATVEQLGCKVFPVRPDRKQPAIKRPYELATDDPDVIREWWAFWPGPRSRIGVPMRGLACLDFDMPSARRAPLVSSVLDEFAAEFGDIILPGAYVQRTRSGGLHIVCRASPGVDRQWDRFRNYGEAGAIDLKAGASFILVDPAPGYEFTGGVRSLRPDDLQEWPPQVVEALATRRGRAAEDTKPGAAPLARTLGWDDLAAATRNYRPSSFTSLLLFEDCRRLAAAPENSQEETLSRIGFVWGMKARSGYISAERALTRLANAAMRMANYDPRNPWTRPDVEWRLQRAMIRGYDAGRPWKPRKADVGVAA